MYPERTEKKCLDELKWRGVCGCILGLENIFSLGPVLGLISV